MLQQRNEQVAINTLLGTGALGFWNTGDSQVDLGTPFNPNLYTRYNPGGKPLFTGQDLDPNALQVNHDDAGRPQIDAGMRSSALKRFQSYTASNIGHFLTITLDGKILQSAIIQAQINSEFVITGQFTDQQARAIVTVLKSGPLPVELNVQAKYY